MVSRLTPAYSALSATVNQVFMVPPPRPCSGRFRVDGDVAPVPNGAGQRVGDVMRGWRPGPASIRLERVLQAVWGRFSGIVASHPKRSSGLGPNREPIDVAAG